MRFDAVQTIKDRLTMRDVLEHYGYQPNRANFICCPFHREKTPSMKIFKSDFHCFGCGANGDVISFVQKLFNLSFPDTLKKIDFDFGLNLYGTHTFEELRQSHYKQKSLQAKREKEKRQEKALFDEYLQAIGENAKCQRNEILYCPKSINEEMHPLYVDALRNKAKAEANLDYAEERWRNYQNERRNNTTYAD